MDSPPTEFIKKRAWAAVGFVNELVDQDEIARGDFFTQAADGTGGDDPLTAHGFEGKYIGTIRDGRRRDGVANAMAGEESDGNGVAGLTPVGERDGGGGRAERGIGKDGSGVGLLGG